MVSIPVLVVLALPPIFAIPLAEYQEAWWAVTGLIICLACSGPVASAGRWAMKAVQPSSGSGRQTIFGHKMVVARPSMLALLGVAVVAGAILSHDSESGTLGHCTGPTLRSPSYRRN